jgi:uncharacterized protein (DUF4415 family)
MTPKKKHSARKPGTGRANTSGSPKTRTGRRKGLTLMASVEEAKLHSMKIADFYRPLKRPVTLRLDADVLAWFKKDGRRYQTRINSALRKVMEREMKQAGG